MNEVINFCIHFLAVFICNLSYDLCFKKLNNVKLNLNFKNIITMFIMAILVYLNNTYINIGFKTILVFIIMCINFKILFNLKNKKTVISYIMIFLVLVILEIIITNLLSISGILNNSKGALALTFIKFSLSVTIAIIEYVIFSISIINKLLRKLLYFFVHSANVSNISYLMFITMTILGILNIDNFATNNSTRLIILLIIIFAALFVIIIKSKTKEEILKTSNTKLISYNEKYGQFLEEYKIYKHNIKHKLAGIKAYGNKKVNELIDDLLEEETTFSIKNNELYNVPNGIKGIVAEKLYNVNFNIIIDNKITGDPFSKLKPREFNSISESIGICLDNAIEASVETTEPVIIMDLYEDKENVFVKIGNNFANSIDIEELGVKNYSTKNRGSGFGLFSIIKNKMIKEKISIINDIYYIELKIKKHAD